MTETFQLLTAIHSEDYMSRACLFVGHKKFLEGRESLKDDRLGCPCTVIYDNIEKE
jgi:hypothetical protein